MTFHNSEPFTKEYSKLPEHIKKKVKRQLKNLATYGITHTGLSARKMAHTQSKDVWEMRVDYHFRITFHMTDDTVYLRHVGTHEIYKNP